MKKRNMLFVGTLAVLLAFGLVLVGCDNGSTSDGGGGGEGGVPSELVGKWYSRAYDTVLVFEITSANKLIMSGQNYDASVSGKTLTVSLNGATGGKCEYSISGSEMTITNGELGFATLPSLSPLIKK
jgi:hypothetical protein